MQVLRLTLLFVQGSLRMTIIEKGSEVGAVDELHGKEERVVLSGFEVSAVHNIAIANLAQRAHLAQKAAGESLVAAQFRGKEFEGARLSHVNMLGEVNGSHAALAELAYDAVGLVNHHPRPQLANLVEQMAVDGAGGLAVGIAGVTLRTCFHAFALLN